MGFTKLFVNLHLHPSSAVLLTSVDKILGIFEVSCRTLDEALVVCVSSKSIHILTRSKGGLGSEVLTVLFLGG